MKKSFIFILMSLVVALTACGNDSPSKTSHGDHHNAAKSVQPLVVKILTGTSAFSVGEKGTLKIKVTKGKETVADAEMVQFEIWKKGHKKQSVKYDAANEGDGIYRLKHTFDEAGTYYVIAHVTARGSHTMPKKKFVVGDSSQ